MTKRARIYINPRCSILFSSYYILGLYEIYGKENVKFSAKYFKDLHQPRSQRSFDHYMSFILIQNDNRKRFVVDYDDKHDIDASAHEWCDVYAKINYNKALTLEKYYDKIVPIPPSFGVRIWSKFETLTYFVNNWINSGFRSLVSLSVLYDDYLAQYNRAGIGAYTPVSYNSKNGHYVFMIGRLWGHQNCIEKTNPIRRSFVEACKSLNVNFEGGFYSNAEHPEYELYKEFVFTKKMGIEEYIEKTKKSALAFNTPAVHDCHGWKLGEYLALGKAIVSTPLTNYMAHTNEVEPPYLVVNDPAQLTESIESLMVQPEFIRRLEKQSIEYYNNYAAPNKVIETIIHGWESITE